MSAGIGYDNSMSSMTPRHAYADGEFGQIHYTSCGSGTPLILLHWAPSNGRQYETLLPEFAAHGLQPIAVDIPGYGRSHKHADGWSCGQLAAEIARALTAVGIEGGFALGGHLSAAIVAEMSIAEPRRWRRVVLDGSPTLSAEEMSRVMAHFAGLSPALAESGSHRSFVWDMTERFLSEWDPDYAISETTLPTHYAYMADYLQMGFAPIRSFIEPARSKRGGLATYNAIERWPLIPVPVLALTAEKEALRAGHPRAVSLLKDMQEHCFAGSHPLMDSARAAEYAAVVVQFLRAIESP